LESVEIPSEVTEIGRRAFAYCTSLKSIVIPSKVKTVNEQAFQDCISLESLTINPGVENLYVFSFYNCSSLKSVVIPSSVSVIGDKSFTYCSSLTEINVSENNTRYYSIDGVLFDREDSRLLHFPCGKNVNSYIIPEGITSIFRMAFAGCDKLTNLTLPSTLTDPGDMNGYNMSTIIFLGTPDPDYFYQNVRWGVEFDFGLFYKHPIDGEISMHYMLLAYKNVGGDTKKGVEFDFKRNSTSYVGMTISFTEKALAESFAKALKDVDKSGSCDHEYIYFCWSENIRVVDRNGEHESSLLSCAPSAHVSAFVYVVSILAIIFSVFSMA